MRAASIEGISRRYGKVVALKDVTLEVPDGELLVLLGPSGSGKTTILRILAGLERPGSGRVLIGDRVVNDPRCRVPPEDRGLGMVFQDLALWPHLTVRKSLELVLEHRCPRDERKARAVEAAKTAGIEARLDAKPATLSGGEKQRVAIARALILEPKLLLFDEPLTGLDEALRIQMRDAIVEIQRRLGIAAVYVTHHPEEALAMASRVAVLESGQLLQVGSPRDVYEAPASRRVASILGQACFLPGRRTGPNAVETAAGVVPVADGGPEGDVVLVIRPRSVRIDDRGRVRGCVRRTFFEGVGWRVLLDLGGEELVMESPRDVAEGEEVALSFDPPPALVGSDS